MYSLIEHSKNYSKATGSFWNYYRNEPNSGAIQDITYSIKDSESFDYKTSITGGLEGNNTEKKVEIAVRLKYLSNFWRTLDKPLINCEINLTLTWSENCVITSKATRDAESDANPAVTEINNPTGAIFKIKDTKLYVPVITLSTEDNNKLLYQLNLGFKRTIKWNKYYSEMTNQAKTYNLNYLIVPTFIIVKRLFVLSFKNENDGASYSKYYIPNIEIKDFNVLIENKIFFNIPIKNKEETYEKIIEISKNSDYTTGNLLDYEYFSKHCRLITMDLSKQIELENPD